MDIPFFRALEREPSSLVAFAGNRIDRQSENRTEDALALAFADPRLRVLQARAGRVYLKSGAPDPSRFSLDEAKRMGAHLEEAVLLGASPRGPVAIAPGGLEPAELPEGVEAVDCRAVYRQGLLDAEALGEVAQGLALLAWHANHRHCGRCGGATQMRIGGYKRACPACGAEQFPRTDPVAIMLALKPGACLLGRSPHFDPGVYSCLAGFIEPGETIEDAVRRETLEEAGIRLGRVAYHASQPWPFPHSLMIGCYGEALDDAVAFDARELEDCRWFARDEVRAMIDGAHPGGLRLPPPGAVASHLIRHWAQTV